jgi:ABC-type amino acid transport substrate-binding protein
MKKINHVGIFTIVAFLMAWLFITDAACGIAKDKKTVKVRVTDYAPLFMKDANRNWTGMEVELVKAVVEDAGLKCEFVEMSWVRAILEIENGGIDLLANASKTKEREEFMHFVGPERYTEMVMVVKDSNKGVVIKNLDDLAKIAAQKNTKFGIQYGVFYSNAFTEKMKDPKFAANFEEASTMETNVSKIKEELVFGFFEDKIYLKHLIKTNPQCKGLAIGTFSFGKDPLYFGISKKTDPAVVKAIKASFDKLKSNGTLDKIIKKYS